MASIESVKYHLNTLFKCYFMDCKIPICLGDLLKFSGGQVLATYQKHIYLWIPIRDDRYNLSKGANLKLPSMKI